MKAKADYRNVLTALRVEGLTEPHREALEALAHLAKKTTMMLLSPLINDGEALRTLNLNPVGDNGPKEQRLGFLRLRAFQAGLGPGPGVPIALPFTREQAFSKAYSEKRDEEIAWWEAKLGDAV